MRRTRMMDSGFTVVELLVVVGVIAAVIVLLIPAIQRAREASLRVHCLSNLGQIGLAFHAHHDAFKFLPSNGGGGARQVKAVDGSLFLPMTIQTYQQKVTTFLSIGLPAQHPTKQTGSWAYALLPYLGETTIHQTLAWGNAVPLLICPSRRTGEPKEARDDEYGRYVGGGWKWAKTDYGVNPRVARGRPYCKPLSVIRDGTSNTILVGEKVLNTRLYNTGGWFYDEPYFFGNSTGVRRWGTEVLRDSPDLILLENWGSAHPTGAQFLYADGSARTLTFGLPKDVVLGLLTPAGGEPIPQF